MSRPDDMPPVGSMYLYDAITPPLPDGHYRMQVSADARFDGAGHPLVLDRYFDVDGPRFALPQDGVALVFPPRNGHGAFDQSFPQIVLGRRTLPWERPADRGLQFGTPTPVLGVPAPTTPVPWMALLLFEEDECRIHGQVPLEQIVPEDVFERLGRPEGIVCDCVEADAELVKAIMPSRDELTLLTHVRQVNIDDRELSAGDSDGWFAVVMANRLPWAGSKYVACLVSIEERADVVAADPPAVAPAEPFVNVRPGSVILDRDMDTPATTGGESTHIAAARLSHELRTRADATIKLYDPPIRLVLLHRWMFTSYGDGTFHRLMQSLDVGLFGLVAEEGRPAVSDTGHLPLLMDSRAGVEESVWYRSPLVPHQLTRDPLGPYHSADQARRVTPETGAEDVTYAAAFEIGRLLAAADGRLAQELMGWRRGAYRESSRRDLIGFLTAHLAVAFPAGVEDRLEQALVPLVQAGVLNRFIRGAGPIADVYGLAAVERAPGLDAVELAAAWRLSAAHAAGLLAGARLAPAVEGIDRVVERPLSIDNAATDTDSLGLLHSARKDLINAARVRSGEEL